MPDNQAKVFRELRIAAVQNGFIVNPRNHRYSDGDEVSSYVFPTVELLAAWMLKQEWWTPGAEG